MQDEKKRKVDQGLSVCHGQYLHHYCSQCPYPMDIPTCVYNLHRDARDVLLAQEPCEDAVSRKDVINVLQSPCDMRYVNGNWHPCIGDYIEAITNLSAVVPKAHEQVKPVVDIDTWKCGNCGHTLEHQELLGDNVLFHEQYNYCPECGRAVKWE